MTYNVFSGTLNPTQSVSQLEQNIYSVPKVMVELGATGINSRGIGSTLSSIRIYYLWLCTLENPTVNRCSLLCGQDREE